MVRQGGPQQQQQQQQQQLMTMMHDGLPCRMKHSLHALLVLSLPLP
jgi:hypothetical protein